MKKMIVVFLVLMMVFVMVGGVVGAHEHGGPRHGGLGYWMNYDFEDGWESACQRDGQTVKDLLGTTPRGCSRWLLARHHMVAFLNLTEVHQIDAFPLLMGDEYFDEVIPRNELSALREAFHLYIMPALWEDKLNPYSPDYSREYSRCSRLHMLELKDILEAWNEGN